MTEAAQSSRSTGWCGAISAESFGGEPSRYDEKYDQLLVEIGKLDSLHGEACDWGIVYECADALTRTRTKDMTLLGSLCVALYKKESWPGLAAGLQAYAWLVEHHSDEMFPKPQRVRGRAGAYEWMTQRLNRELEAATGAEAQHESLQQCLLCFQALDAALRPQLGDLHPSVQPIVRRLRELVEATKPAPPPPEPTSEPVASEIAAAPPPPAAVVTPAAVVAPGRVEMSRALPDQIENDTQVETALDEVRRCLRVLARYQLQRDVSAPLGYQLAHLCSFIDVVPGGARMMQGISSSRQTELEEMVSARQWEDLLGLLPQLLDEGDLDFDVERCVAVALERAGHRTALATLNAMAHASYRLLSDRLVIGEAAVSWLDGLGGRAGSSGPSSDGDAGDRVDSDSFAGVLEEARRAASGSLEAGCGTIQAAIRREGSKAGRFRLQLLLAELCLEGEAPELARPILRHLYEELEGPVREWAPEMLTKVAVGLLECHRQLGFRGRTPSDADELDERLLSLLSQIDPQTALRERAKGR